MYIVNTSFMVDAKMQERWLEFIKEKYITFLGEQGFKHIVLTRVISIEATDQFTYSLQIYVDDMSGYKKITEELFMEYETIAEGLFGTQVMHFTSLMKIVE